MARRPPPADVLSAIEKHFARIHPGVSPAIGAEHSRRTAANVTWRPAGEDQDASIRCRLCPEGGNRYYVNFDLGLPTDYALRKIRAHFAGIHGIDELPVESIRYRGNDHQDVKAVWEPATAWHGAGFACLLCPDDERLFLDPPNFRDARHVAWVIDDYRKTFPEILTLSHAEQAEYVEAIELGHIAVPLARDARRHLATAQRQYRTSRNDELKHAIQRVILRRVRGGDNPTRAIGSLAYPRGASSVEFARYLANEIPALHGSAPRDVARWFGVASAAELVRSERTLWNYWKEIPKDEREEETGNRWK